MGSSLVYIIYMAYTGWLFCAPCHHHIGWWPRSAVFWSTPFRFHEVTARPLVLYPAETKGWETGLQLRVQNQHFPLSFQLQNVSRSQCIVRMYSIKKPKNRRPKKYGQKKKIHIQKYGENRIYNSPINLGLNTVRQIATSC